MVATIVTSDDENLVLGKDVAESGILRVVCSVCLLCLFQTSVEANFRKFNGRYTSFRMFPQL